MRLLNNMFIAALLVSIQASTSTSSTKTGSVITVYEPNSIPQNEEVLRLLLRLASHTANRLIYLKKEAGSQNSTTTKPSSDKIVPQARIELSDDRTTQKKIDSPPHDGLYGKDLHSPTGRTGYATERLSNQKNPVESKQSELKLSSTPKIEENYEIPIEIEARAFFDDPKNDTKQNSTEFKIQSNNSSSTEKIQTTTSNFQSQSTENAQQPTSNSSKLLLTSSGAQVTTGASTSGTDDPKQSKLGHQAKSFNPDLSQSSSLLSNANQTLVSEFRKSASKEASSLPSSDSKKFLELQDAGSKLLMNTVTSENLKNRTNELLDKLVQNQSGDSLSKVNSATNALLNPKSLLTNSREAISGLGNNGNQMPHEMANAAYNTGTKIVEKIIQPMSSVAEDPTDAVKVLGDLTNAGSQVIKSGTQGESQLDRIFPIGNNIRRAASVLMEPNSVSQIGNKFMNSVPLFRSFPDISEKSSRFQKFGLGSTYSKNRRIPDREAVLDEKISKYQGRSVKEETNSANDQNLQFDDKTTKGKPKYSGNDRNDDEKTFEENNTKLNLDYYASQFADALRPVKSSREQSA